MAQSDRLGFKNMPFTPNFELNQIEDKYVQKNFQKLKDFQDKESQLVGFRFLEIKIPNAVTNLKVKHSLGYKPEDIVVLKVLGAAATFDYSKFSDTEICVSTTGPGYVRCFVGTYKSPESTDFLAGENTTQSFGGPVTEPTVTTVTATPAAASTTTLVAIASGSIAQAVSAVIPLNFYNIVYDPNATITIGSAWVFRAPQKGIYLLSCASIVGSAGAVRIDLYKNGVIVDALVSMTTFSVYGGSTVGLSLEKGDTIQLRSSAATTLGQVGSITIQLLVAL